MKHTVLLVFLCCSFFQALCQNEHKHFGIGLETGMELGWWIHNLGSTDANIPNNKGWERSYHTACPLVMASVYGKWGRFKPSIQFGWRSFNQYYLHGPSDAVGHYDRPRIAPYNESVPIYTGGIALEYDLIKKKRYALAPMLAAGFFDLNTIHPDVENFGLKPWWDFGISNIITVKHFDFIIKLHYNNLYIFPKVKKYFNERHDINFISMNVGVRWWL